MVILSCKVFLVESNILVVKYYYTYVKARASLRVQIRKAKEVRMHLSKLALLYLLMSLGSEYFSSPTLIYHII